MVPVGISGVEPHELHNRLKKEPYQSEKKIRHLTWRKQRFLPAGVRILEAGLTSMANRTRSRVILLPLTS
jgi:hypothetical protein